MKQGNFTYMLVGLLIFFLLAPSITKYFPVSSSIFIQITFMTLMIIGVWSLKGNSVWFNIGFALASVGIILSIFNIFLNFTIIYVLSMINVFLFCSMSSVIVMKQVLFKGKIDSNKLIGSVCIYLLMGLVWGSVYIIIGILVPDAFEGIVSETERNLAWEYIYFSYVTLSTLGYGDITPIYPLARSLAYLEAICGQLYIAILIASLVGAFLSDKSKQ